MKARLRVPGTVLPAVTLALVAMAASALAENIDPADDQSQYAWGENIGWINFEPSMGPGVTVTPSGLTGYAWGENVGWISLSCANTSTCATVMYGVTDNGSGALAGYAWGENIGWVNFSCANPPNTCGTASFGVAVNESTGVFSGYAWGENVGWISFNCTNTATCGAVNFDTQTDCWGPANIDSGPAPPTQNGGLVGNSKFSSDPNPPGPVGPEDDTVPNGDALGDPCDVDDDNDADPDVTDADDGPDYTADDDSDGNPAIGCLGGSDAGDDGPSWDSNCDGRRDGVSSGTCASLSNTTDSDGDTVPDRHEVCRWGTSNGDTDSDNDGITDCIEIVDVNGSGAKEFLGDLVSYARAVQLPAASWGKDVDFDYDGTNQLAFLSDLFPVAKLIMLPTGSGGCNPTPLPPNP